MVKLGSLGFYYPSAYKASGRESFGANLAELGLANAVLRRAGDATWDIWDTNVAASLHEAYGSRANQVDLNGLKHQFGDRIRARKIEDLPAIALEANYVFISNTAMFSHIAEVRSRIGGRLPPICSLTHSLYTNDLLSGYSQLLMSAERHDVIVASSLAGKRTLRNFFEVSRAGIVDRLGRPELISTIKDPRIEVIPFGVDLPSEAEIDNRGARQILKIPTSAFTVLYFGRITEEYKADLDPLLQAVHHLRLGGHNVWLVIAGQASEATYSQHLEQRLLSLGLSEISIFIENCPQFLKTAVYSACDVMVSPADSVQETFGLSILEAMSHERAVIASDWSGYREIVEDGKNGFLIRTLWVTEAAANASITGMLSQPRATAHYLSQRTIMDVGGLVEKLTLLLENRELRIAMGRAGRARIESDYSWSGVADRFYALWNDQLLMAQTAGSRPYLPSLECFSHYATATLQPDDLLARLPGVSGPEIELLTHWQFREKGILKELRHLMILTLEAPVSIGELREEGFAIDSILWLAKKGLRRIVSSAPDR